MPRCKNCNKSISFNSDGFCTNKCRNEYKDFVNKEYNGKSCFNLIAAAIEPIFTSFWRHDNKQVDRNKEFLKSPVVASFCDCSHNFNQDKLIKEYDKLVSTSTETDRLKSEQMANGLGDGDGEDISSDRVIKEKGFHDFNNLPKKSFRTMA